MLKASEQCLWGKQLDTCRCQLNSQRQTSEPDTDSGNGGCIVPGHLELGFERLCALQKERHRIHMGQVFLTCQLVQVGDGQRRHDKLKFPLEMKCGTAGHQDFEALA